MGYSLKIESRALSYYLPTGIEVKTRLIIRWEKIREPEAFHLIMEIASEDGVEPENWPGCFELEIDKHWWIAMNGHPVETECSLGYKIPPFSCYVEYNRACIPGLGWPVAFLNASGGNMSRNRLSNEDALIRALRRRLKTYKRRVKKPNYQ